MRFAQNKKNFRFIVSLNIRLFLVKMIKVKIANEYLFLF